MSIPTELNELVVITKLTLPSSDEITSIADLVDGDADNAIVIGGNGKLFVPEVAESPIELVGTALRVKDSGGNARGAYAVDLQTMHAANQVASGNYATIGGGRSNTANNGDATVGGGHSNTASDTSATVGGGRLNTASNYATTVGGGRQNTANGGDATVGGGYSNTASGNYSTVGGGFNALAQLYGQEAYASGMFAAKGDAQRSTVVARKQTTNNTPALLRLDGNSVVLAVPNNKTLAFTIHIVGRKDNGDSASYVRHGTIKNVSGTTSLVGSVSTIGTDCADAGASGWSVDVTADDTNDALAITVTGAAASNIRWVARVELTEVGWL